MSHSQKTQGNRSATGFDRGAARAKTSFFVKQQTLINFWLDALLLLLFLLLVWTSVVVRFVFPPVDASRGYSLWRLNLDGWMGLQFASLVAFLFGVVLHLMMHWSWVCGVLGTRILRRRRRGKAPMDDGQRTILGVGMLIVLLNVMGLAIAMAALSIQSPQ